MEPDKDLFGNPVEKYRHADPKYNRAHRSPTPKGYAAKPGSGPAGESCKTCKHYCVTPSGRYRKCALIRWRWTHGAGTDIRANSPACERWENAKTKN